MDSSILRSFPLFACSIAFVGIACGGGTGSTERSYNPADCVRWAEPNPALCADGTWISGGTDERGCPLPPTCNKDTVASAQSALSVDRSDASGQDGNRARVRERVCEDGSQPVACFVTPCSVNECHAYPTATCVDNYCGGCNADFYLNGKKLTEDECSGTRCEDGSRPWACFVAPCSVTKCDAYPNAQCVDNYCGGCNADFYLNGEQLTKEQCTGAASAAHSATYTFASGYEGFTVGFADYPVGDEAFYELQHRHTKLPEDLGAGRSALLVAGNNHSDDLFMFLKRKIAGLAPNTDYVLNFKLAVASNAASSSFGIGGGPGTAVSVKIGASSVEPKPIAKPGDGHYRMNIDVGVQANSGKDMSRVGDIGVTNNDGHFEYKNFELRNFGVRSNRRGEVWIVTGTDSGFEGLTTVYFTEMFVEIQKAPRN